MLIFLQGVSISPNPVLIPVNAQRLGGAKANYFPVCCSPLLLGESNKGEKKPQQFGVLEIFSNSIISLSAPKSNIFFVLVTTPPSQTISEAAAMKDIILLYMFLLIYLVEKELERGVYFVLFVFLFSQIIEKKVCVGFLFKMSQHIKVYQIYDF